MLEEILLVVTTLYSLGAIGLIYLNLKNLQMLKTNKRSSGLADSCYDNSTGLISMRMFRDVLVYSTSKPKDKEPLTIMALSLDLDESYLDEVQKQVITRSMVRRIKDCLRVTDFVTRADDGTFYILLTRVSTVNSIKTIANRLIGVFNNAFYISNVTVVATPYLGVATYPNDDMDIDTLISNAYIAMKHLKDRGKTGFYLYECTKNKENQHSEVLISDLKEALTKQQFVLYYQPQYSLSERGITGVEALIRWNHPKRGLLTPNHFIRVVENSDFMEDLTNWVLREACRQHKEWGIDTLTVSVNIPATLFKSKNFIKQVEAAVRLTAIKPENLNLEITESLSIEDKEYTLKILQQLKSKGFKLSIDDFGVGQSSLSYIKDFPIDYIKLDRSFLRDLEYNVSGEVVLRSIIKMVRDLNLKVLAEGVETKHHLDFLLHEGCDEIQGFYLSKPLPPDELYSFITSDTFKMNLTK